jgi:hypothetical protein
MIKATEPNEMNLVEGEVIEEIEEVEEGWWTGVGDQGRKSGLFPGIVTKFFFLFCLCIDD